MSTYVYPVLHGELGIVGVYLDPREAMKHLREFRETIEDFTMGYMRGDDTPAPGDTAEDALGKGISVNLVHKDSGVVAYAERQMIKSRYVKDVR